MTGEKNKTKYPMATVAFYGPDNKTASKVVVGIIASAFAEPDPMRKWVSGEIDIRDNKQIQSEIGAFLKEHHVEQVITIDRIIGCPHEEGSDYPVGAKCPFCPFWRNRNRFTHENEEN